MVALYFAVSETGDGLTGQAGSEFFVGKGCRNRPTPPVISTEAA